MPLYQLLCLTAHYAEYNFIRDLVRSTAMHVMDRGGVVRDLDYWGPRALPQRMRRHGAWHNVSDYWTMHFDASPATLKSLNTTLRADPRVVRWSMIKLGHRPEDIQTFEEMTIKRPDSDKLKAQLANEVVKKAVPNPLGGPYVEEIGIAMSSLSIPKSP
ncbi:hypothetical protein SISSUDRAFT_1039495 [Sistotremastrum suecicum HHB10207 ss-3]|uniref:Ribosomal protein S6 n=1 Tax=Sistotremastrum suecicum HHB10207 ss-3 TaxID=1314776 RepID=A0A166IYU8_9AGAM|nr:hypothetical protein SISSUDRAFT_1039495 [Sistotremastrum suecicum HHB10207 ss-3]